MEYLVFVSVWFRKAELDDFARMFGKRARKLYDIFLDGRHWRDGLSFISILEPLEQKEVQDFIDAEFMSTIATRNKK